MKRTLLVLVRLASVLTACAGKVNDSYSAEPAYGGDVTAVEMRLPAAAPEMEFAVQDAAMDNAARSSAGVSGLPATVERMVIQNADLSIVVADPKAKMEAVTRLSEELGGFVVSSNVYFSYTNNGVKVPEAAMTIRIPAESLDSALESIKADTVEVQSENRSGQDVTKEYTDLRSRLRNLEAAEEQLTQIMDDATDTEQVLATFQELTYYREQIEVVKGQMQYYEESAALSAISLTIIAEETIQPIEIGGWQLGSTATEAVQDLVNYLQGFTRFVIRFILLTLPVLISLFIPLYLVFLFVRSLWRKRKAKKEANAASQQETK
ncbi:MAG: DUF4349 domain-containing protein [Anaerolineales bacterium]|nr:DUF4349 domain-containing protein [Anaerolineales bacterium]